MLRVIYKAIKHHLSTNITALEHIDFDLNQMDQTGNDAILASPSVFIRFHPHKWESYPNNVQRAQLKFDVKLVVDTAYGDERDLIDTDYINQIALSSDIFKSLMNERFTMKDALPLSDMDDVIICESITRTNTKPQSTQDKLIISTQTFECTIFDYAATRLWTQILANLEFDIKYHDIAEGKYVNNILTYYNGGDFDSEFSISFWKLNKDKVKSGNIEYMVHEFGVDCADLVFHNTLKIGIYPKPGVYGRGFYLLKDVSYNGYMSDVLLEINHKPK